MTRTPETPTETNTIDELLRLDNRIRALTADIQGLFDNYISELIHLQDLRAKLAGKMVDDRFPPSSDDKTSAVFENLYAKLLTKPI
jgi:hypothetical protein